MLIDPCRAEICWTVLGGQMEGRGALDLERIQYLIQGFYSSIVCMHSCVYYRGSD